MATAKKCDRCGAYFREYVSKFKIEKHSLLCYVDFDLCPTCMDKLKQFMTEGKSEKVENK